MIDPAALAQYEQVVSALMSQDNAVRSQAEDAFNQLKQQPDVFFSGLIQLARQNANEQIRSLSAVLLRRVIGQTQPARDGEPAGVMARTSAPVAQLVKQELLAGVQSEQVRHIRKKLCECVASLGAGLLGGAGEWPELLPFMLEGTRSGNPALHEASLIIFGALSEFFAETDGMKAHHSTLLSVFTASLRPEQEITIRVAALKAVGSFLCALTDKASRKAFGDLAPFLLQTISDALANGQEDECRESIEVLVEIAESQPMFLKKTLPAFADGMIKITGNTDLEDGTRHLSLEFLLTICENATSTCRKMAVGGASFCAALVPIALRMMLELEGDTADEVREWENDEDDERGTEITNYDVGEEALDRISIALGGEIMLPVLNACVDEMVSSADWKQRHAALIAISQSGEGCEEQMMPHLGAIVTKVVAHFGDAHPRVRWAAINTIGQMSTDFGPKMQEQLHATVVPALVTVMDDGCVRVQAHAAAAVINFCEHCEKETLHPYLQGLLGKLHQMLQRNIRRVQEQAVTAVASVADVAQEDFLLYYDAFMPGLRQLLTDLAGKEFRMLRGKAMECISLIGVAVGKEKFAADAKEVMDCLIQTQQGNLDPDDPQVSFLLQASARICKCLGADFQPYLPFVIPPLLQSAQIDPELEVTDADEPADDDEDDGLESVTVNIRGQGHKRITIRTSALEEKATACNMLHTYAEELQEGFLPYVEQVASILIPLVKFQYMDDVRTAAMMAMPELLNSCIGAHNKGLPSPKAGVTIPQLVGHLKDVMLETILEQLKSEPDIETLALLLEYFAEVVESGVDFEAARFSPPQQAATCQMMLMLFNESNERRKARKLELQEEEADEEEAEEAEAEAEREEALISNLVECLGGLLRSLHSEFLPHFEQHLLAIFQQMISPEWEILTDRTAALCVFDDIIEHCSDDGVGGSARYIPALLPVIMGYAADPSVDVRQAAVYGLGVLCEKAPSFLNADQLQAITQALVRLIEDPHAFSEDNASASDNAVSALGKLCKLSASGDGKLAAAALPRWLATLPLSSDKTEALVVHRQLCDFVEASNAALLGENHAKLPEILCIFGRVLDTDTCDDELAKRISNLLKQVHAGLPHVLQQLPGHPAFAKLTDANKKSLERAISS